MKTNLIPFTSDMIPEAGRLLADRHARNRTQLPLLPTRFEDPQVAAKAVETLWKEKYKRGYGAFRDGYEVAYRVVKKVSPMIAWAKHDPLPQILRI